MRIDLLQYYCKLSVIAGTRCARMCWTNARRTISLPSNTILELFALPKTSPSNNRMNWVYHGEFFRSGKRLVRTVRSITCGAAEYNRSIADTCVRRRRCLSRFHHHRGRCITRKIGAQTKKRRHWPKYRASGSTTLAVSRGTYYLFPRSKLGRARAHAARSGLSIPHI